MIAFQKGLIIALMLIATAFWSWVMHLDSFYCHHGATTAVVAEDRIHPKIVCHGRQVFLTEHEKFNIEVLYPSLSIGSVLIAGLLDLRWKHFVFKKKVQGPDPWSWFRRNRKK